MTNLQTKANKGFSEAYQNLSNLLEEMSTILEMEGFNTGISGMMDTQPINLAGKEMPSKENNHRQKKGSYLYKYKKYRSKANKPIVESVISHKEIKDKYNIKEDTIDFNKKKNQKTINNNAEEVNRMMASGELDNVRILDNGEIMGKPELVNKLKNMKKETEEARENIKEDIPSAAKEKVTKGEMSLTKYANVLGKAAKNLGITKYEALRRPTKSDIGQEKQEIRRRNMNK